MINLSYLSKLLYFTFFTFILVFNFTHSIGAEDIWKKDKAENEQENQTKNETEIKIKSPILSDDINKVTGIIDEKEITKSAKFVIGIFDPEENNFNLNMWEKSDGEDIKKVLNKIIYTFRRFAFQSLVHKCLFSSEKFKL